MRYSKEKPSGIFITLITITAIALVGCGDSTVNYDDHHDIARLSNSRGDINLNGIPFEIAEAVLFSNYFVYGDGVFTVDREAQIKATDANADGITLGVADLVYMVRIITGDALPYLRLVPVEAQYRDYNGVLSVDKRMGAAFVIAEGNVVPENLADNMDMKFNFDGTNTRILIFSTDDQYFSGEFLNVNGAVLSIEMATFEGARVSLKSLPTTYALMQNYPNPFYPTTKIDFELAEPDEWNLTITNINRKTVATFSGNGFAGTHSVTWDATGMGSGLYFYTLRAGDFTDTKKMSIIH